jgi:hypothetical protein
MKAMRHLIPRIENIFFAAVFFGIAAGGHRLLNFDGDLPRHLLMGRLILQTRTVPTIDVFSFRTTGFPAIPHEWLSQVIFAGVYEWLGLNGVVLLAALIMMLVWMAVFREAQSQSRSLFFSLLFTALAAGAGQIHVLPRPHIFTYLLTAIWIALLERAGKKDPGKWWLFPLIMLVWVNLHGMFVLGIVLWGIYLIGSFLDQPSRAWFSEPRTKSMLLAGAFSLIATLLSPSGIHIWETIISLGSNSYITSKITEYQSANFHLPETWLFLALLLLTITGFSRAKKVGWTHTLLTVAFTFLALYTSRMIPLFAIVVAPLTAKTIAEWIRDEHPKSRFAAFEGRIAQTNSSANGWIWIPLAVLGTTFLFQQGIALDAEGKGNVFDDRFFPVRAVDWLESHSQDGRMFNEFDWGGYLLLRLWPREQIFMDGHTHIYGEVLTREYEQVITLSPGWEEVLEKYNIAWAILRAANPVGDALSAREWREVYRDETAVILKREP